jgi:DNA-binding CsgD family transcriptional regulator
MATRKKTISTKKRGRGRPQLYPLTTAQEAKVVRLINEGLTSRQIQERMDIHEFAVLRVRRAM